MERTRMPRRHESGQAIVEFALALPLILLLLCGLIELGWVGGNALTMQNVTREGVRTGIVVTDTAENSAAVTARIQEMTPEHIRDSLEISVVYSDTQDFRAGDITEVTRYRLKAITPFAGLFTENGEFHLQASCTMKMS